jgi:hypothetical protein
MLDQSTMAFGKEQGFDNPIAFYFVGRGGVLGDVDGDVVASAFGFWNPSLVRSMWSLGSQVMPPRQTARLFAEACHRYGREHLAGIEGLDDLADIGEQIIESVDSTGLTLFAGWRGEPMPDDAPARAAHVIHVLREHRGSAHVVAVVATGLSALEAILTQSGAEHAKFFGWTEPMPEVGSLSDRREGAEELTDRLVAPAFTSVSDEELARFTEVLSLCRDAMRGQ